MDSPSASPSTPPRLHQVSSTASEKPSLSTPATATIPEAGLGNGGNDIEAAQLDDKSLLGHRSWAETAVLCFANLIPPLGVAWVHSHSTYTCRLIHAEIMPCSLSTRDCGKVTVAILLTCCFYLPGVLTYILIEGVHITKHRFQDSFTRSLAFLVEAQG